VHTSGRDTLPKQGIPDGHTATTWLRVLTVTWVNSFTGHAVDLDAIGVVRRRRDVAVVVNASQAICARPFQAAATAVDAVVSCGYKWLCGPYGMVTDATAVLTELGVERARIHRELFYVEDAPPPEVHHAEPPAGPGAEVTVILDGRTSTVTVPPGTPVLDGAQKVRPDLPFACKGGVCGTCRARVVAGKVTMRRNFALEEDELRAGYVLTCQSLAVSDAVTVDYDG